MPIIGNAWVTYEKNSIYILKPVTVGNPGEQQVLIFVQETGLRFLCCSGQDQFAALISCMAEASFSMTKNVSRARLANDEGTGPQRFAAQSASLEIETRLNSAGHQIHDLTLQLCGISANSDQLRPEPCERAGSVVKLTMTAKEFAAFARAFKRIASAEYEPAFVARIDEWFLPPALISCDSEEAEDPEYVSRAVEHIETECPDAAEFWIEILNQLGVLDVAGCPEDSDDLAALDEDWALPENSLTDYCEDQEPCATAADHSDETPEFVPWLERLTLSEEGDYEVETSMFYTVGKDHAFEWMNQNPEATQVELVEELIKDQRMLPPELARETAEKISARVFHVREKENRRQ